MRRSRLSPPSSVPVQIQFARTLKGHEDEPRRVPAIKSTRVVDPKVLQQITRDVAPL